MRPPDETGLEHAKRSRVSSSLLIRLRFACSRTRIPKAHLFDFQLQSSNPGVVCCRPLPEPDLICCPEWTLCGQFYGAAVQLWVHCVVGQSDFLLMKTPVR